MDRVLPLLIDRAAQLRDLQAAAAQQARVAADQAEATLGRLQSFRVDCLAQSAAGTQARTTSEAMAGYQHFVTKLDDAIGQQSAEARSRHDAAAAQQAVLVEAQRRLLAFETLQKRRANERNLREQRKLQRESDAFAARAARQKAEGWDT
jgi:flagellar FliJ protein